MRKFSASFKAHISSGATTLCNCWLIERTDGMRLGFTDHDVALTFDGDIFAPAHGLDGSEITAKKGAQVDTSEVLGILHSSAISEEDIALGRYDGAKVSTFRVNWRDISMREKLRVDTIGEITRADGMFHAELRSGQQALNIPKGRHYQSMCDVLVGAPRCGVDINTPAHKGLAIVSAVQGRFTLSMTGLGAFAADWFASGHVVWNSGKRIHLNDRIISHTVSAGVATLGFARPVGDWVMIGDSADVHVGCNRLFSTCREKFANGVNFQGFPHIPGGDFVFSYPTSGDRFDGQAIVK